MDQEEHGSAHLRPQSSHSKARTMIWRKPAMSRRTMRERPCGRRRGIGGEARASDGQQRRRRDCKASAFKSRRRLHGTHQSVALGAERIANVVALPRAGAGALQQSGSRSKPLPTCSRRRAAAAAAVRPCPLGACMGPGAGLILTHAPCKSCARPGSIAGGLSRSEGAPSPSGRARWLPWRQNWSQVSSV